MTVARLMLAKLSNSVFPVTKSAGNEHFLETRNRMQMFVFIHDYAHITIRKVFVFVIV